MRSTLPLLITLLLASVGHLSAADRFVRAEGAALTLAGMPLFIGELVQHPPYITENREARFACAAIDLLEKEGGDLIAIWAWHFPQHPKYSVDGLTYPSLLRRISEFNMKHAYGGPSQHPEDARSHAEPIKS